MYSLIIDNHTTTSIIDKHNHNNRLIQINKIPQQRLAAAADIMRKRCKLKQ